MGTATALLALVAAVVVVSGVFVAFLAGLLKLASLARRGKRAAAVDRRCGRCGRSWQAEPGRDLSKVGLRIRRRTRRRVRRSGGREVPSWSRAQGWSRCPSCLSRRVRTAGEPPPPRPLTRGERVGIGVAAAGLGALLVALVAFLR